MQFRIGERVRFLHETGEGIVKRLLPGNMAEVEIDDFLELEVPLNELVPIAPGEKSLVRPQEKKVQTSRPQAQPKATPELVIFQNQTSDYEVWLLNHGEDLLHYNAFFRKKKAWNSLNTASVSRREQSLIHKFRTNEFHQIKALLFQFLPYPEGEQVQPISSFNREINPKMDLFDKRPEPIEEFRSDGYRFPLRKKKEEIPTEEKEKVAPELRPAEAPPKPIVDTPQVVDLHIQKLTNNIVGLSAGAILQMQVTHFEKVLTEAVMHRKRELIFIHGIGNGKLKKEIHAKLEGNPFVAEFGLAEPVKYGNGATRVLLRTA